ncbi:MAG TPA: nucleoside recognition domain-containing protein [Bacteroidota bacterium]|nr:nucleoside recognition domain-containing protein [Bacteroidota bacterium]
MLNYIWLTLIVLGIGVAVFSDWRDISTDRYRNGQGVVCDLAQEPPRPAAPDAPAETPAGRRTGTISVSPADYRNAYGEEIPGTIAQKIVFPPIPSEKIPEGRKNRSGVELSPDEHTPALWRQIQAAQKTDGVLRGTLEPRPDGRWTFTPDAVKFLHMNAVTNDGIVRYAKIAVELAIGLIGIMALWLGLMKIAEQAGLVAMLSRLLKPVTTRLFPDIPPDHPAVGAMLMNISANMLGLANAATPLGLKAMEELDKLNRKTGVATDAMCTFLVINTSSVQLIPATVIAIRAAAGSANPTEIVGPVIFATTIGTVVGVAVVKLLARLPVFRRQIAAPEGP